MPTITQKDYEVQQKMVAENPNISFGIRDFRNPDVIVESMSTADKAN